MLLLIDGSAMLVRHYHAHADLTRSDGLPVGGLYGFCNMLWGLQRMTPTPEHVIVCWDSPDRRCFRHDLSPSYKANRAERDGALSFQFGAAKQAVAAFDLAQTHASGFEADDVIATIVMQEMDRGNEMIWIMSSDKDLMQLICPTVMMLRPGEREPSGVDYVIDRFGVPPYQMGDLLALVGDASDNIPGARGIGEKKAAHLLTQWGSLDSIIEHASDIPWPSVRAKFAADIESVRLSRELVRLRHDVPLDPILSRPWNPNLNTLLDFLQEFEFAALRAEVEKAWDEKRVA